MAVEPALQGFTRPPHIVHTPVTKGKHKAGRAACALLSTREMHLSCASTGVILWPPSNVILRRSVHNGTYTVVANGVSTTFEWNPGSP